jgi:DNA-binding PadR family transcriptional regulator
MSDPPTLTTLRLAILGLISMQPMSGYDLRKVFETTPMGNFSSSPGAIYPALKSLEKNGWVHGVPDKQDTLRPRLVYSLTDRGDEVLNGELDATVTRDDLIWRYDQMMLRFAFMERRGLARLLAFLEELLTELDAYVAHLEEVHEQTTGQTTVCGRLALEQGIEGYRANARWARRAIRELEGTVECEGGEENE